MDRYIAFDCETGGIGTNHSLLTVWLAVLNQDLNIIDSLDLRLKPNNGEPYSINPQALAVNGINLIEHDKVAVTLSEGGRQLRELLYLHSNGGKLKLVPVGHNVVFDEIFIHEHLLNKKEWQKYVSYRHLDTGVIARYEITKGRIPNTVSGSLTSLANHFNIEFSGKGAHDAQADTTVTIDVLRALLKL